MLPHDLKSYQSAVNTGKPVFSKKKQPERLVMASVLLMCTALGQKQ